MERQDGVLGVEEVRGVIGTLVVQVRGHVGGVAASGAHQVRSEVEKRITKTERKAAVAAIVVARVRRLGRDGVAL